MSFIKIIFYIIAYLVAFIATIFGEYILAGIWLIIVLLSEILVQFEELNVVKDRSTNKNGK